MLRCFVTQRDNKAFDGVVQRHAAMVLATARRIAPEAAEDVAQIVFTELARRASTLLSLRSLGAWLHRVAVAQANRMVRQQIRSRNKHAAYALAMNADQTSAEDPMREALPLLDAVINELPVTDRELIFLRYHERLSFKSVAERLGKSEVALRQQANRAMDRLASGLKRRGVTVPANALVLGVGAAFTGSDSATAAVLSVAARTSTAALPWAVTWTTTSTTTSAITKALIASAAVLLATAIPLAVHLSPVAAPVTQASPAKPAPVTAPQKMQRITSLLPPVPAPKTEAATPPPPPAAKNYSFAKAPIQAVLLHLAQEADIEFYSPLTGSDLHVDLVGRMTPFAAIQRLCEKSKLRLRSDAGVWVIDRATDPATSLRFIAGTGTESLLQARPQLYEFSSAGLGDVLRFLATDAHLNFISLPDDHPLSEKAVAFRLRASPFASLSRLCNATGIILNEEDTWQLSAPAAVRNEPLRPVQTPAAIALRQQPAHRHDFSKANLFDVLRFLASEAKIQLDLPAEDSPVGQTLITFSLNASPFSTLETIAHANRLQLSQTQGIWKLLPAKP